MSWCRVLLWAVVLAPGVASAQPQPSAEIPDGELTSDNIWALDRFRHQLRDSRKNYFIHEEKQAQYYEGFNKLTGAKLRWAATVDRVTDREVHLRESQWGRTRVVLLHFNECGMIYGNPRYRDPDVNVPPSTHRYFRHAAESTLEIGLEIPLEVARTLEHADLVQLTARIERVETRLRHGNGPDTLLYVSDIQATKYMTEEERLQMEQQFAPLNRRK